MKWNDNRASNATAKTWMPRDYKTDNIRKERAFDAWINSLPNTETDMDRFIKQLAKELAEGSKKGFWHPTFSYDNTIEMVYFPHWLKRRGFNVIDGDVLVFGNWATHLGILESLGYLSKSNEQYRITILAYELLRKPTIIERMNKHSGLIGIAIASLALLHSILESIQ